MLTNTLKLQLLAVFASASCFAADTQAQPKPAAPAKQSNVNDIPYTLHPENDKTDSYAVPSDSTEQELDDEMKNLNNSQKAPKKG